MAVCGELEVVAAHRVGRLALVTDDVDVPDRVSPQSFDLGMRKELNGDLASSTVRRKWARWACAAAWRMRTSPAVAAGLIS